MRATVYYDRHDSPSSSALTEVYHDSLNKQLYVEFPNGTVAGYAGVPVDTFHMLTNANSVGAYFAHNIKGHYTGINGDVELIERPSSRTVPTPGSVRFEVVIKINGDLKLQVAASDFGDASTQVENLLNEITTAAYTVQSVTKVV